MTICTFLSLKPKVEVSYLVEPGEVEAAGKKRQEPRRRVQFRLQLVLVEKSTQSRVVVEQEDAEEPEADLREDDCRRKGNATLTASVYRVLVRVRNIISIREGRIGKWRIPMLPRTPGLGRVENRLPKCL